MLICVLIVLLLLILIYKYVKEKQQTHFSIGTYLLFLYIISILFSFLEDNSNKTYTLEASFYFLLILLLFIFPVLKFNTRKIEKISLYNEKLFRYLCNIFIVGGICAYIFFLPIVYRLFTSGDSILILRTDMVGGEVYFDVNVFYYLSTFICQFYPAVLICYFFSITNLHYSKLYNNLLLFSSTAYIVNVLASVGRDGFVLWSMSYIFSFMLFYKYLSVEQIRIQKSIFKKLLFIFLLFFIPITVARFFMNGFKDGILAMFSYFGQQFGNFNNLYNKVNFNLLNIDLSTIFPFLQNEQLVSDIITEQRNFYNQFGVDKFVFATFIGSFCVGIGPLSTLVWASSHAVLNSILINNKRIVGFGSVLYITLLSQIPLHGIFYYKLGYSVSNIYVICMILLSILFSYNLKIR